jgi:diguanylate cyclase (GGDEF)-like protein
VACVFLAVPTCKAETSFDFVTMDDEIRREPWLSYQKILEIEKTFSAMARDQQLWLLLRKAQSENLLYSFDEFKKTVTQAQQLIDENTSLEITSRINVFAGIAARLDAEYTKSEIVLKKALKQAHEKNLNQVYVQGKQELAYVHGLNELFETSLLDLQEAYVEAFAIEDHFLVAVINETYGAIYGYMREYDKSIVYYEKALDTYERLEYRAHIAEAVYGIAASYRYWQKYDLAIEYFELYQKKMLYVPNVEITFHGSYALGMTLAERGSCERALLVIEQALSLKGIIDYNAELYKRQASCLIALKKFDEAEIAINKAIDIFESIPELLGTTWHLEVFKVLSELAYSQGDFGLAYELITDYYQKYTQILIKNSASRLVQVRAAMGAERQDVELSLLQQRDKVQQLKIEQQQQQNIHQGYLIFFGLFLMAVIIGAFIFQSHNAKKMTMLSVRDPLSGLYNRRYIFRYLKKTITSPLLRKAQLSVMLLDIDDFKAINDSYGHPFGDEVIKKIAEIGQATLRNQDVIGRIGGEEFLCILPSIDEFQCKAIAEQLLDNINQHRFIVSGQQGFNITISIGFSISNKNIIDEKELYIQADKALYSSKKQGKNCATMYTESMG